MSGFLNEGIVPPPQQHAAATIPAPGFGRVVPLLRAWRATIVPPLLIVGDLLSVFVVGSLSDSIIGKQIEPYDRPFTAALLFVVIAGALGLYAVPGPSNVARLRLRTIAGFSAVGLQLLLSAHARPPMVLFVRLGEVMLLIALSHYVERTLRTALRRAGLWCTAVLIVNYDEKGRRIAGALRARPEIGLSPIGFVVNPAQHTASNSGDVDEALPLLQATDRLHKVPATLVFTSREDMARLLSDRQQSIPLRRILLIEDASDLSATGLRPRLIGDVPVIDLSCEQGHTAPQLIKRSIELSLAVLLALVALPVIAILAAIVFLVDPGPPFYRQARVGQRDKSIQVWKVRTMYSDAERRLETHFVQNPNARGEWERYFKLKHDPRILPLIGNFVRRSSLDELPQLWNVIRGDMSLIGPRPFPAYHVRAFDPEFQTLRASIKPGLTGLWQISSRSNGDVGVQKEQDSTYIRNWSLWLDFYILLETLPAVLRRDGAR